MSLRLTVSNNFDGIKVKKILTNSSSLTIIKKTSRMNMTHIENRPRLFSVNA